MALPADCDRSTMPRAVPLLCVLVCSCIFLTTLQTFSLRHLSNLDGARSAFLDIEETSRQSDEPTIRVLLGIFTADFAPEQLCRNNYRELFSKHPHVCDLTTYIQTKPANCRLIYTFVLGGNPDAPTLLVDDSRPYVVQPSQNQSAHFVTDDMQKPDMLHLNIRENMNDGKSPTWMAYAAKVAKEHFIDYIVKQDSDTVLQLERYFQFVDKYLLPPPRNRNFIAGSIYDKMDWDPSLYNKRSAKEQWAWRKFGSPLHIYAEGQWYLMSPDLAEVVQREAASEQSAEYIDTHEDHDVSTMAFQSNEPIIVVVIAMDQRHWVHPVKVSTGAKWFEVWEQEIYQTERYVQTALIK